MFACVLSSTPVGIDALMIRVEVQVQSGVPLTKIVGLADAATRESRERVLAAIQASGFRPALGRVTVNLAPADVRKVGSALDLPIALSLLTAYGCVRSRGDAGTVVVGELGLGGEVRGCSGVLSMADAARRAGARRILVPSCNAREASLVEGIAVIGVATLKDAVAHFENDLPAPPFPEAPAAPAGRAAPDFQDVEGQTLARRALEIAAAGGHNVLMVGPPGVGKTMLAQRVAGVLPDLTFEEAIEVTKVHSVAGLLPEHHGLVRRRPFRSPHHTISRAGLVGGGPRLRPGDVSLAHRGILFLDEFSEFPRGALELLRQPLEDRVVHLARASGGHTFPASFMLVASMNPCPCGFRGSAARACRCHPAELRRHWQKVSGPLLDRMDLVLEVPEVPVRVISRGQGGEPSHAIRQRVAAARSLQATRYGGLGILVNAELTAPLIKRFVALDPPARATMEGAAGRAGLSARAYHRVLKVARSIADLDGSASVTARHAAEALAYRLPERELGVDDAISSASPGAYGGPESQRRRADAAVHSGPA